MSDEDPGRYPVPRFWLVPAGALNGAVVDADPGLPPTPGEQVATEWVAQAVSAARLDDEAREYRWTGQVLTPAPGRQIIVMTPGPAHNGPPG